MANTTVTVLEADGVTQTDVVTLDVGRQAAAASKSTNFSTEDKAVVDAIAASLVTIDGRVDGLETLITSTNTKLDTAITALQIIDNMVLAAGSARVGTVGLNDGTNAIAFTDAAVSASAFALPVIQHPDGQNANGQATMANSTPTVLASDHSVMSTAPQPLATGGLSVFRSLDLDETEEEVKATAGCLYKIRATNRTTSVRYLKLYNLTAANTTVGSSTPLDTIPIPANASDYTVLTESFGGLGLTFSTALSMAVTTGFADADTGAPGANDVIVSAYYK
jgi:hypothetical protein